MFFAVPAEKSWIRPAVDRTDEECPEGRCSKFACAATTAAGRGQHPDAKLAAWEPSSPVSAAVARHAGPRSAATDRIGDGRTGGGTLRETRP